jgi:hypothetical protein
MDRLRALFASGMDAPLRVAGRDIVDNVKAGRAPDTSGAPENGLGSHGSNPRHRIPKHASALSKCHGGSLNGESTRVPD